MLISPILSPIRYRDAAIRVVVEDLHIDMTIYMLEAASCRKPLPIELLGEGLAHHDPRVRWTEEQRLRKSR